MRRVRQTLDYSLTLMVVLCMPVPFSQAAETIEVQVEHGDGAYHIYFEILINAPRNRVYEILTDYANLQELSPGIVRSELLSGEAGGDARVDITLKPCVWILCKSMHKVSTITINAYGAIVYTTVPEASDFKRGKEQVIVQETRQPGQTRVTYNASLVPDFFVPPLVGSWLMRKHIIRNLEVSNRRVEKLATP